MGFTITTRESAAGNLRGTVYLLADDSDTCRAEVWPFMGFNCLRWQVRNPDGSRGDLLYMAPDWEANPVPTRSGHPVLFPFPNRLREGRFTFEGKTYQLPLNESTGQHAIHGFTPRNPWRVIDTVAGVDHASITAQFRLSQDLPSAIQFWPADFSLTLTYRLSATALRVEAIVENPDDKLLPFGLGYHPYFCIPTAPGALADEMLLSVPAESIWEANGGLPSGRLIPVPDDLQFELSRPVGATVLDTLFGGLKSNKDKSGCVALLSHQESPGQLTVTADTDFRELLLFTPPHRRAIAVEPYTCASDAPNLITRGIDCGLQILTPGKRWESVVEYRWQSHDELHSWAWDSV